MSEITSFPWDNKSAEEHDRNVSSDLLAEGYFHKLNNEKNGLFSPLGENGQVIVSVETSAVVVKPVAGAIKGRIFSSVNDEVLTLPYADNDLPRYDLVVVRWSRLAREVITGYIKGVAASSPQYPALTRNSDVYEVCLASVLRAPGDNTVDTAEIRDERLNTALIELIPVLGTIDTTDMDTQLKALIERYNTLINEAMDETIAGSLQLKIEANTADIDETKKDLVESTNIKSISLESIEMTIDSPLDDICAAMPDLTRLDYSINALANNSIYPQASSVVSITRINVNRVSITLTRSDGSANESYFNTWGSDVGLSGWTRYAVTDNLFGATISDLDALSGMGIYYTSTNPTSFPSGLGGNSCVVINTAMSSSNYAVQLAFGFGSDKIAIRRKNGSTTWTAWKYTTLSSAS